jgi:hypothetical protein
MPSTTEKQDAEPKFEFASEDVPPPLESKNMLQQNGDALFVGDLASLTVVELERKWTTDFWGKRRNWIERLLQ